MHAWAAQNCRLIPPPPTLLPNLPPPTATPQPGNILVHADGRFLLADFDVSKDTQGANAGGSAAGAGGVLADRGGGGGVSDTGDGALLPPPRASRMEAETTRTSVAGTSGFMAPEVCSRSTVADIDWPRLPA